ncbi:Midasin [Escovopsis weberi]|uniref:Midasin n=1 Tax=Escovopsis weberi TaxID=150374 RepID=A0A0M8N9D4_ESCWE|nr:Midasin [Escovopsis weberi]
MTIPTVPAVPPRPSRSPTKESSPALPLAPPRPVNTRIERSRSPNPARFAQSPLNGGINPRTHSGSLLSLIGNEGELTGLNDFSGSQHMPSVGEEGMEYSVVAAEMSKGLEASPEQTRSVGDDIKLHAPRPSLPAESAKRRVMTVTRTNSDKAATLGFGKGEDRAASREPLRRKPSSAGFSTTSEQAQLFNEEHGIPEIGQRVPMNPHLGDVQAPSPAVGAEGHARHHSRKLSARSLPPGSYGMHGHGMTSQDELEKAYYKKHPEMLARDQHTPLHDRQNDFAMSSSDLNKLVRDTASRAADRASSVDYRGTPADEVAFRASEEYARRSSVEMAAQEEPTPRGRRRTIHIEEPKHSEYYQYGAEAESPVDNEDGEYNAPILASDEVDKEPKKAQHPVVRPRLERNDSSYSQDGRSTSRPRSRPTSTYNALPTFDHTRLENVEEYEPLFPDEAAKNEQDKPVERKSRHHFPSKDVWEDAPGSAFETTEVSTPDMNEEAPKRSSLIRDSRPITPAHAFALQQEQLAEKEAGSRKHNFLPLVEDRPRQEQQSPSKLANGRRFPSRDVWEDAPESSLYEAEVSQSKEHAARPGVPARPMKKTGELLRPPLPERPSSVVGLREDAVRAISAASSSPTHAHQSPAIPPRPARKASSDSKDDEASRQRAPAPAGTGRPVGGKIAALKAGFMSDLNKRLSQGPAPAKREEPAQEDAPAEQSEKVPLTDARKGRARGPQRRAPTRAPAVATIAEESVSKAETSAAVAAVLSVCLPQTIWSIDPEDGSLVFAAAAEVGELPPAEEISGKPAERALETSTEEAVVLEEKSQEREIVQVEQPSEHEVAQEEARAEEPRDASEAKEADEIEKIESRAELEKVEAYEAEVTEAVEEKGAEESKELKEAEDEDEDSEDEFESSDEFAEPAVTKDVEESQETEVAAKPEDSARLEEAAAIEIEEAREVEQETEQAEEPKESKESVETKESFATEESAKVEESKQPRTADGSAGSNPFGENDETEESEDFQEVDSEDGDEEPQGAKPNEGAAAGVLHGDRERVEEGAAEGAEEGAEEGVREGSEGAHAGGKDPAPRSELHKDPEEEEVRQEPALGIADAGAAEASGDRNGETPVQAAAVAEKAEERAEAAEVSKAVHETKADAVAEREAGAGKDDEEKAGEAVEHEAK